MLKGGSVVFLWFSESFCFLMFSRGVLECFKTCLWVSKVFEVLFRKFFLHFFGLFPSTRELPTADVCLR